MRRAASPAILFLLPLITGVATAQSQDRPPPPPEHPPEGFWPTEKMRGFFVNRITDEMAKVYEFDEDQLQTTRDLIKSRFPQWMDEHRDEIQPVMNEWFEALISDDPPTAEEVADWASRALPLFEQVSTLIDETAEDMRGYLTEEQQLTLDGQIAAMDVGRNDMRQRLTAWKDGGYDWKSEWPRSDDFRREEEERRKRLEDEAEDAKLRAMGQDPDAAPEATAGGAPPTQTDPTGKTEVKPGENKKGAKKDEWDQYVEDFIRRYQLVEDQQNRARLALKEAKEARETYLKRKMSTIDELEKRLNAATTKEDKDKIRGEIIEVNRPVDRQFQQLKDRLDRLPTRKQRSAAAKADIESKVLEKGEKPGKSPEHK